MSKVRSVPYPGMPPRASIEPRQQARIGHRHHLAGFAGAQLDQLEADEPHWRLAGRKSEVKLAYVRAFLSTGIGHHEARRDRVSARDLEAVSINLVTELLS